MLYHKKINDDFWFYLRHEQPGVWVCLTSASSWIWVVVNFLHKWPMRLFFSGEDGLNPCPCVRRHTWKRNIFHNKSAGIPQEFDLWPSLTVCPITLPCCLCLWCANMTLFEILCRHTVCTGFQSFRSHFELRQKSKRWDALSTSASSVSLSVSVPVWCSC